MSTDSNLIPLPSNKSYFNPWKMPCLFSPLHLPHSFKSGLLSPSIPSFQVQSKPFSLSSFLTPSLLMIFLLFIIKVLLPLLLRTHPSISYLPCELQAWGQKPYLPFLWVILMIEHSILHTDKFNKQLIIISYKHTVLNVWRHSMCVRNMF